MRLSHCLLVLLFGVALAVAANNEASQDNEELGALLAERVRAALAAAGQSADDQEEGFFDTAPDNTDDYDDEDDDGEDQTGDALLSLKQSLQSHLETEWAINEQDKAQCCLAAFDLCEKPPNLSGVAFQKQRKSRLNAAKKKCAAISTRNLKNVKQICKFYSNVVNCAYTPNTAKDFDMYFNALPECCSISNVYCKNQTAENLFQAKKACLGFAARTGEGLCDFSVSKDCHSL